MRGGGKGGKEGRENEYNLAIKLENILLENATQQDWKPVTSASPQGHNGDAVHFLISVTIKTIKGHLYRSCKREPSPQRLAPVF